MEINSRKNTVESSLKRTNDAQKKENKEEKKGTEERYQRLNICISRAYEK